MTDWPEWTSGWTPPIEVERVRVSAEAVAGLAALLDTDPRLASQGEPLPLLWHWIALAAWSPMALTGPDGHPGPGDLMPPGPYPRRMWLGTAVTASAPPVVGASVRVERTVIDVAEKTGGSGPFGLVTLRTTVTTTDEAPLITEDTQFAYRPNPAQTAEAQAVPGTMHITPGPWLSQTGARWVILPNPVVLARFSALTANGHRIHYDVPYATQVEGYPNVLVHGPLMAIVLAEVARRERPEQRLRSFSCRARRPFFLGHAAGVEATDTDELRRDLVLEELDSPDSGPFMTARVTYE